MKICVVNGPSGAIAEAPELVRIKVERPLWLHVTTVNPKHVEVYIVGEPDSFTIKDLE